MTVCNINRRAFNRNLLAGAGTLGMGAIGVPNLLSAADAELKMAFFISPKHPIWARMMTPLADKLEAANVGFKIKRFPGGQIGGRPPGAYKRIISRISDIEFHIMGYTSTVFPRTLVAEIPLQWNSPREATTALWKIFDKHLANEYKQVKVLAMWTTDVPVVMTNKLVRTPDDLKGLKLRTPSRNQADIIKGLGAIPVAMPMTQTYGALEKGVVDGAIVGISVVNSFKLQEVVKHYIVDLPFGYSPFIIGMNRQVYDGLTSEQKAVLDKNIGLEFSYTGSESYQNERERGIATVKSGTNTSITTLTAEERKLWVDKLKTIVDAWITKFEGQGLPYRQIYNDYLGKNA